MGSETHMAIQIQQELTRTRIDQWVRTEFFKPAWWVLLLLFIALTILWWKTVDKSRLHEIVLYVCIIIVFTLALDELGEELTLWDYPYNIIPLFPPMSSINLSCLPAVYSMIYQLFYQWKHFTIATVIMSAVFCFVLEPLFQMADIYQHIHWKHIYSFPIYIAMGLAGKAIMSKVASIKSTGGTNSGRRKKGQPPTRHDQA